MALLQEEVTKLIEESTYKFYCYLLRYPDGTPFYAGKGKKFRLFDHETNYSLKHDSNKLLANVIKKIFRNGEQLTYSIEGYFNIENEAYEFEEKLVQKYGRRDIGTGILCNLDGGGRGGSSDWSKETKLKRLETFNKTIKEDLNYSKRLSNSITQAYINDPTYSKRISNSIIETYKTTDLAKRLSIIHKNRNKDPEVRKANSKAQTKKHAEDPSIRVRQANSRSKYYKDPKHIKKMSDVRKQFNINNPEKYEINQNKAIEAARTIEARKKNSDAKIEEYKKRKEVIDRCEKLIKENKIVIKFLDKRKSVKEFKLFEKKLMEKVKWI